MIQQILKNIYIFPILYTFINTQKNNIQTLRKLNNFGSRAHSFLLTYKDKSGLLAQKIINIHKTLTTIYQT